MMKNGVLALAAIVCVVSPLRADDARDEFARRRAKLDWSSPAGALELARWGIDKKLRTEPAELLIELLKKFASNGLAKKMLVNELGYVEVEGERTKLPSGAETVALRWAPKEEVEKPRPKAPEPKRIDLGGGWSIVFPSGEPTKVSRAMPTLGNIDVYNVPAAATGQGYQASTFLVPDREVTRDGPTATIESVFKGTLGSLEKSGFKPEPVASKEKALDGVHGKEFDVKAARPDGTTLRFRTWILLHEGRIVQLAIFATPLEKHDEALATKFFESLTRPK